MPRNLFDIENRLKECGCNSCIMKILFEENLLPIEYSEFLFKEPEQIHQIHLEKIEGMLIGTAIGDALGVKFESKSPEKVVAKFGDVKAFHPKAHITDDTQMTFWTLEVFIDQGWLNPQALAERFTRERIRGIGHSVKQFFKNYKDLKIPWYLAGVKSAGNGALMKLSPVIIPHLTTQTKELWSDAVVTTFLVYNDRLSISSAVSFTNILWKLMKLNEAPEPEWWLEEYVKVAREIEGDNSNYSPRFGSYTNFRGPAWYYIEMVLERALKEGWGLLKLSKNIGSGAYLLETIPFVLYTLMTSADKPFEALVDSVTKSKDSDIVGAIVGYLIGALFGVKVFPKHLLDPTLRGKILPSKFLRLIEVVESYLVENSANVGVSVEDTVLFNS